MRNHKGFTAIELLIVIAILAILAAIIIPMVDGKEAHGMEIGKYYPASDNGTIAEIAQALRRDESQTVTILLYSAEWSNKKADALIAVAHQLENYLINLGISKSRITYSFANKGGIEFDGSVVPVADGTYLYLD